MNSRYPYWLSFEAQELVRRCEELNWTFHFGEPSPGLPVLRGTRAKPSKGFTDLLMLVDQSERGSFYQRWVGATGPHRHNTLGDYDKPQRTIYGSVEDVLKAALKQIDEEEKADES